MIRFQKKFRLRQVSPVPSVDWQTRRRMPWACIALMMFIVPSDRMTLLRDMPAPSVTTTASWPGKAAITSSADNASPAASDRSWCSMASFSGWRANAVTLCPASSSCSTVSFPTVPVAPKTITFIGSVLSG
jgi:hypothetical protein